MKPTRWRTVAALAGALLSCLPLAARAATELRISRGFGTQYLPLYVMEEKKLIEKHARDLGVGEVAVSWSVIDGGNRINDAMLSRSLDIAAIGTSGFLTLWAKTVGSPKLEVIGLSAVGSSANYLFSRNPAVKTLADLTDKDRIAIPGIKTSFAAFVLEMAAAKAFGESNYAKLDTLTVGMPHPEALAALLSGKTEINAHFSSPPFSNIEAKSPDLHVVFSSVDVIGNATVIMAYTTRRFHEENPKLVQAFLAALKEADAFIAADHKEAAAIYIRRSGVKVSQDQMLEILSAPDNLYEVAPKGMMLLATFMKSAGITRTAPKTWKELFVPEIHDLPGE